MNVDNVIPVPSSPAKSPQLPRRRPGSGALLTLVNGVLAGVSGVYVGTHSVVITVITAAVSIVLAMLVLIFPR